MVPRILVMIPAHNEEKTVGDIIRSTRALYPDYEIVVIDDGSTDRTVKIAAEAGAEVVSLPFHCGGTVAVQAGYCIAAAHNFDYAIKIDADGQHKPEDISKVLFSVTSGEADIAVGSRYLKPNSSNHDSSVKDSGRVFSSTLVSMLHKIEVTDITSGMRAWNSKAIQTLLPVYRERKILEDSVFWIAETILAQRKGLTMKEVPIDVLPRNHGKSKSFSPRKMLLYPFRLIATLIQET